MNLLIVDDDDTLRLLLGRELGRAGHRVTLAETAGKALACVAESEPDVVLLDLSLPDRPGIDVLRTLRAERPTIEIVVLTAHGSIDTALGAMKLGAFDYLQKPCNLEELEITLQSALERRRLTEDNARLRDGMRGAPVAGELVGCGPAFDELQRFIRKVAASDTTVLVRGATGTGKDVVARAIHQSSPRREQPFVVVDCAALQESLLPAELFGHEKGAFTGADRLKYGLFETADHGTIFLDEVGDVPPPLQAGLLRVLETGTFRRVGGTREIRVDVRLIAATNRDMERLIKLGRFREDLYFRLNAIHVELLPLERRPEEIPRLAKHFLERRNRQGGASKRLSQAAIGALQAYRWPGNIRELRNVIEWAAVFSDGDVITPQDLPPEVSSRGGCRASSPGVVEAGEPRLSLSATEREQIVRALSGARGHRARAARLLGISPRTLYRKLHEHGIAPDEIGPG